METQLSTPTSTAFLTASSIASWTLYLSNHHSLFSTDAQDDATVNGSHMPQFPHLDPSEIFLILDKHSVKEPERWQGQHHKQSQISNAPTPRLRGTKPAPGLAITQRVRSNLTAGFVAGSRPHKACAATPKLLAFPRSAKVPDAFRISPRRDGPAQGNTAIGEDVPVAVGIVIFFASFI